METQARVLATLNKLKEVRLKKQNLGAIEDAINNVKNNADEIISKLTEIKSNFFAEVDNSVGLILTECDYLGMISTDYQSQFENLENELNIITEELKTFDIEYNDTELSVLKDEMGGLIDASKKASSMNELTFYS
jgi:hypothetical protein